MGLIVSRGGASGGGGQTTDPGAGYTNIWAINGGSGDGSAYESPASLSSGVTQLNAAGAQTRLLLRDGGGVYQSSGTMIALSGSGTNASNYKLVQNAPDELPELEATGTTSGGTFPIYVTGNWTAVRGITIRDSSSNGCGHGLLCEGDNTLFQHLRILDVMDRGGGNTGPLRYGQTGFTTTDSLVEYCDLDGSWAQGQRGVSSHINCGCIEGYETDNIHMRFNRLANSRQGFYPKGPTSNGIVGNTNWVMEYNLIDRTVDSAMAMVNGQSTGRRFRHNLCLVRGRFIDNVNGQGGGDYEDLQFIGNTYVCLGGFSGIASFGCFLMSNTSDSNIGWDATTGPTVRDNIFHLQGASIAGTIDSINRGSGTGLMPSPITEWDFNWYYGEGSTTRFRENEGSWISGLAAWQAAKPTIDQSSQSGSLTYTDTGSYDYSVSGAAATAAKDGGPVGYEGGAEGNWTAGMLSKLGPENAYTDIS